MQKNLMYINLEEAHDQLREIIEKFKSDDYDIINFQHDVEHMMSHINTAYNIREWNKEKLDENYEDSLDKLRRVPDNNYLIE